MLFAADVSINTGGSQTFSLVLLPSSHVPISWKEMCNLTCFECLNPCFCMAAAPYLNTRVVFCLWHTAPHLPHARIRNFSNDLLSDGQESVLTESLSGQLLPDSTKRAKGSTCAVIWRESKKKTRRNVISRNSLNLCSVWGLYWAWIQLCVVWASADTEQKVGWELLSHKSKITFLMFHLVTLSGGELKKTCHWWKP